MPKNKKLGPTLIAAAITSKPFLRQRGQPVTVVDFNGAPHARVPLFKKGVYKHPFFGDLVLDDKFTETMMENHQNKVTDYPVSLDMRHTDSAGALAFLDKSDGGWLALEGKTLVAYGPIVDEEAKKVIESKRWRFCSPEYHPDYESHLVTQLSDISNPETGIISLEDTTYVSEIDKEKDMTLKEVSFGDVKLELDPEVAAKLEKAVEVYNTLSANLEEAATSLNDVTAKLEDAQSKLEAAESKIAELEKKDDSVDLEDVPEAVRVQLEEQRKMIADLQRQRELERVALAMERARNRVDADGRKHAKPFLDVCETALKLNDIKHGERTVKLSANPTANDVVQYLREFVVTLMETVPGTVLVEQSIEDDNTQLEDNSGFRWSDDEFEKAIEAYTKRY